MNKEKSSVRIRFEARHSADVIPELPDGELIVPADSCSVDLRRLLSFLSPKNDLDYSFRVKNKLLVNDYPLESYLGGDGTPKLREQLCIVQYEQVRDDLKPGIEIPVDDWIRSISVDSKGVVMYACCDRRVYFYDALKRSLIKSCHIRSEPSCSTFLTFYSSKDSSQKTFWCIGCTDGSVSVFMENHLIAHLVGESSKTSLTALLDPTDHSLIVVSGEADGRICVYRLPKQFELTTDNCFNETLLVSEFSPEALWTAHDGTVSSVSIVPSEYLLISAGWDRHLKTWCLKNILEGDYGKYTEINFRCSPADDSYSPDLMSNIKTKARRIKRSNDVQNELFSTIEKGGKVKNLNCMTLKDWTLHESVSATCISVDNQQIVTGHMDGSIRILSSLKISRNHKDDIIDNKIQIPDKSQPVRYPGRTSVSGTWGSTGRGHKGCVCAVVFDPHNSKRVVSAGHDGAVYLWEISSNEAPVIIKNIQQPQLGAKQLSACWAMTDENVGLLAYGGQSGKLSVYF